jgi:hypothetical protein
MSTLEKDPVRTSRIVIAALLAAVLVTFMSVLALAIDLRSLSYFPVWATLLLILAATVNLLGAGVASISRYITLRIRRPRLAVALPVILGTLVYCGLWGAFISTYDRDVIGVMALAGVIGAVAMAAALLIAINPLSAKGML